VEFIQRQNKAGKPAFVWVNFTHMHFRTHTKPESVGQSGRWQSPYHDTMIDHDKNVGQVLKVLDDLGLANNTFVMYSTDNGPHMNSWPDGAMTPFRNEKNSNWEGAYRVPAMVRWPGTIKPGRVSNDIVAHLDWLPTLLAVAGDTQVTDKLLKGYKVGDMTYKVHLDGYNLVPYLTGQVAKSPRDSFFYINDDQQLTALRYDNFKFVFMEQRVEGTLRIWAEPFVTLRAPKVFNLRTDPYERADITSNTYYDWLLDHAFAFVPAQDIVGEFLMSFKEYPQRQKAASFNLKGIFQKLKESPGEAKPVDLNVSALRPTASCGRPQAFRVPRQICPGPRGPWLSVRLSSSSTAALPTGRLPRYAVPAQGGSRPAADAARTVALRVLSHAYGYPPRAPRASEGPDLHHGRAAHARPRHRRKHGRLQHRLRGAAQAAPLRRA
jgi:hypothetical protein